MHARDICAILFSRPDAGVYKCKMCGKKCKSFNGFTTLLTRLRRYHPS